MRIAAELPQTATAKVLKNELRPQKFVPERCTDPIFRRPPREQAYRRFTAKDFAALRASFAATGKLALLDL